MAPFCLRRLVTAGAALVLTVSVAWPAHASATATPASTASATSGVDTVAVTGTDGGLWIRATDQNGWRNLGGQLTDVPAILKAPGVDYFFGVGTDGNVWVRTLAARWAPYGPGGTRCDGVSAALSGSTIAVACRGTDGALWVDKAALPSGGALPTGGGFTSLGGALEHEPSVVLDHMDAPQGPPLFVYFGVGLDDDVYSRSDDGGWTALGGPVGGPVGYGATQKESYAYQVKGAWQLFTWTTPAPFDQRAQVLPAVMLGKPAVTDAAGGSVAHFYVIGSDGAVWTASRDGSGAPATPFTRFGGQALYGVAAVNYS